MILPANPSESFRRLNPHLYPAGGAAPVSPKRCKGCGVEYTSPNTNSKYCSQKCAASSIGKSTMTINRRSVPRTKVTSFTCQCCGVAFEKWDANVKQAMPKYCSRTCYNDGKDRVGISMRRRANGGYSGNVRSRSKAGWRTVGGQRVFFRSTMEANWARYLTWSGREWQYEPTTFWFGGIKRGVVSYTPDFFLPQEAQFIETKGWMDSKSKTKLRRMKKYHPLIKIEVVDWKRYMTVSRTMASVITDWE